ncbi:hypothetical protein B5E80_16850 [Flavonifractor sp. An135]|nr:BRCT domain-containing protein [Flavonifractor sp. An135]OUQ20633.1 hypothetical protein B5E80_16850 [Flavonifractor sp. An135]
MSVGYQMQYTAIIKGGRSDFAQIPSIVKQVLDDYTARLEAARNEGKLGWDLTWCYRKWMQTFTEQAEEALERGEEPMFLHLESEDGDDTHGIFEAFMDALDEQLPGLASLVAISQIDTEYGQDDEHYIRYSPANSGVFLHLDPMKRYDTPWVMSPPLPEEDWIPYGWRHPEIKAPAAKAEGVLSFLGAWSKEEQERLEQLLMGEELPKALCLYQSPDAGDRPLFVKTEEGLRFSLCGRSEFIPLVQNLEFALGSYIREHAEAYVAFCQRMREKRQLLHLAFDAYSGVNEAWHYGNHTKCHFLLSSDGAHLISTGTWFATQSSGTYFCPETPARDVYQVLTGAEDGEVWLDPDTAFTLEWALYHFSAATEPIRNFRDFEAAYRSDDEDDYDEDDYDEDGYYDEEDCYDAYREAVRTYVKKYRKKLLPLFQQAEAAANPPVPERYRPETFDGRFQGKKFVVKGERTGYATEELAAILTGFGAEVEEEVTEQTDYLICGSGVGEPFRTALALGTTILTADYLEDLMK